MSDLAQLTQKLASVLPENDFLLALPIADEYLNKIAEYTRHIPFSGHADAVWETFWMNANSLEKLGKIYQDPALANKNLKVQQAFLLALLYLLETPKALLNTLPARHRSLYYHELLGFSPKDPQADTVAISFMLQKNTPPYRLVGGSLLDAGQDNAGNEITYRTDADILVSNQQLSQLCWTLQDQRGEWQAYTGLDLDKNISLPAEGIRLFAKTPEHESTKLSEQALYLGFNHVLPEETLSVYWSLRAASALDLSWKYYNQQKKWASLDAMIQDNTAGLSVSNLWRVTLPNDIQPGREDKNDDKLYWIKAIPVSTSLGSTENTPKIQCIMANAMTATLNMETVIDDQHFHQRLPAETISQLVIPVAAISHINQPLPSTGGQSRETEKGLLQRAATRIAHRHRALTWNDMRSLLMEQYPQIYDVQFPYVDKLNALPALEEQPVMLIPKNGFNDNDDTLRPEFSTGRLAIMTQWLTQYTSIWSRPKLVNPRYVDVTVRYQAVFATGIRPEYGYRQLALELGQKYMPWGNDNRSLNQANFVRELDFIQYLLGYFGTQRAVLPITLDKSDFLTTQREFLAHQPELGYDRMNIRIDRVSALQKRIAARIGLGSLCFADKPKLNQLPFYLIEHRQLLPLKPDSNFNVEQNPTGFSVHAPIVTFTQQGSAGKIIRGQLIDLLTKEGGNSIPSARWLVVISTDGDQFSVSTANSQQLHHNLKHLENAWKAGNLRWQNSDIWLKDMNYRLNYAKEQPENSQQRRLKSNPQSPYPGMVSVGDSIILRPAPIQYSASDSVKPLYRQLSTEDWSLEATIKAINPIEGTLLIEKSDSSQRDFPNKEKSFFYQWSFSQANAATTDRFSFVLIAIFNRRLLDNTNIVPDKLVTWVQETIMAEFPAHVSLINHWLDEASFKNFGITYQRWQNNGVPLSDDAFAIMKMLTLGELPTAQLDSGLMRIATEAQRIAVVGNDGNQWHIAKRLNFDYIICFKNRSSRLQPISIFLRFA